MVITFHGHQFIKVQFGTTTVAFDPPSSDSEHKSARFGADVVLSSVNHPDFTGGELLSAGGKEPFIITGPGEYEVGGVFVRGLEETSRYGGKDRINTMYLVELEGMNLLFAGALSSKELKPSTLEEIDEVDIMFVPIGGEKQGTLSAAEGYKLGVRLEARLIIPIHYTNPNGEEIKSFLKEGGSEGAKPVEKLTIKPKDVATLEGAVQVLQIS